MPSPFPGMDPFLEGELWPDVHKSLASEIRRRLVPSLRPRYVARLAITIYEDNETDSELGIVYPDVEVIETEKRNAAPEPSYAGQTIISPAVVVPLPRRKIELLSVEIRDARENELITSIEILSPVNKREPGISKYRRKRDRLHDGGVHLLELDLLRDGQRTLRHARLADNAYQTTLIRTERESAEVWPIHLADRLPVVPIPLRPPDPDVPLDLQSVLDTIYDEAAYDLSIDYTQDPPPPPLSEEEQTWLKEVIAS